MSSRISIDDRWVSEEEKAERIGGALAVAYVPVDEDSYGYPSLEAAHAQKPVLTTADSGGVLELVSDGINGLVAAPDPPQVAEALDRLYTERPQTVRMGQANLDRLAELRIDWDRVVEALTE
jgi:glycosyltransferase involved in cell wall biosynthesis